MGIARQQSSTSSAQADRIDPAVGVAFLGRWKTKMVPEALLSFPLGSLGFDFALAFLLIELRFPFHTLLMVADSAFPVLNLGCKGRLGRQYPSCAFPTASVPIADVHQSKVVSLLRECPSEVRQGLD
jgi:hypothetical protein